MTEHKPHVTYRFEGMAGGNETLEMVTDAELLPFDPLASNRYFECWRYQHDKGESNFGCTCGADPMKGERHAETCRVTPIFADVCNLMGRPSEAIYDIAAEMMTVKRIPDDEDFDDEDDECDPEDCPGCMCPSGHPPCNHCVNHG